MSDQPAVVSGATLLSTMAELKQRIEQGVMASPQRLQLAKTYLESLEWGIKGLETMGQKIGFVMIDPPAPVEYPKMLYRESTYRIANNSTEEQAMNSEGFWHRPAEPYPKFEPLVEAPEAPTFRVSLPHGPEQVADTFADEVQE